MPNTIQFHLRKLPPNPTTNPIFCKPYLIAKTHMQAFLKELNHLIDKGVLEHIPRSKWASPTFIIPKKDGRVCWSLGSYTDHLSQIHQVLLRSETNGAVGPIEIP